MRNSQIALMVESRIFRLVKPCTLSWALACGLATGYLLVGDVPRGLAQLLPPGAPIPADPIDAQRTQRYVERLQGLQTARQTMSERAASLMAQNPNIERELQQALANSMMAAGVLQATPEVTANPSLIQVYRTYRGQSGETFLRPELLLWYTFQDNTLVRQQLFLSFASSQREAAQSYATMASSRVALEQLAHSSDQNFLNFRHLSDVMGRRSPLELGEAERLTAGWIQDDPTHAGAALVRAHALRSMGRFDESQRLLDQLDNNFPAMQTTRESVAGQISYLGGNLDQAKQHLDKAVALARDSGVGDAYLIYGWLSMAEQKWNQAKGFASRLKAVAADDVETAILEALAVAYERPSRARDGLAILRRAQLNTSPDDWHYHEALAIVHMLARDRQFANRAIAQAVAVAPSHARAFLEAEQQEIQAGNVPTIDWASRLGLQWQPVK